MAKKLTKTELPEMTFEPNPVIETPVQVLDTQNPKDFLTSKGHIAYFEGQKISLTVDELSQLLTEYKSL